MTKSARTTQFFVGLLMSLLIWRSNEERGNVLGWISRCLTRAYITGGESGSETRRWNCKKRGKKGRNLPTAIFLV